MEEGGALMNSLRAPLLAASFAIQVMNGQIKDKSLPAFFAFHVSNSSHLLERTVYFRTQMDQE